jgi:diguanylate cyclase (GGDEF)-like protein
MTARAPRRLAHGSLAVRLLAVVLVPLLTVQYLVYRRTNSQKEVARAAEMFAPPLDAFSGSVNLLGPAALEEAASVGLATGDKFLPDRATLALLSGIDLELQLADTRAAVDRGFDEVASLETYRLLPSGRLLSDEVAEVRGELAVVRSELDARMADPQKLRGVFSRIETLVRTLATEGFEDLFEVSDVDQTQHALSEQIAHLINLEASTIAESRAVSIGISPFAVGDEPIQAISAGGVTDSAGETYANDLDSELYEEWIALQTTPEALEYAQLRTELWSLLAERGGDSSLDVLGKPETTKFLGTYFASSIAQLTELNAYSTAQFDRIGREAAVHGRETERDLKKWYFALGLVTLGSLLLLALTVRSIVLPLRRLTGRAAQLGNGQFSDEPLPISGPTDLRTVTASFNQLTSTLTSYERQLGNLVDGSGVDPSGAVELPGVLGRSLRDSIQLSRRDLLTGLPNRFAAMERVDRLLAAKYRVGVVLIDLDSFKRLNEGRGFGTGDLALAEVSRRLQAAIREGEFVARLGSDEFLVVAQHVADETMARRIAERLLTEIGQPYEFEGSLIGLSATAGVAFGHDGDDARELVREAEVALHRAKAQGRGRVEIFSTELQEQVEELSTIEGALSGAVERNEFELYLQPIVELESGRLWGAEALIRWNRPGYGILSPDSFLSIAEDCGVTVELERWVMSEAMRILGSWQRNPGTECLQLAVNVSGRHLLEGDLVDVLDTAAANFGINLKNLEIELTETALLADFDRASEILGGVRERGVHVAIDDFGTGYSSMNYLGVLPVDTIKIDRLFVARAGTSGYDRSILEIIVQLGQLLGLSVVAEGVETADQLSFLEARGCDRAQGYLISRPLPESEFGRWVADGSWRLVEVAN